MEFSQTAVIPTVVERHTNGMHKKDLNSLDVVDQMLQKY